MMFFDNGGCGDNDFNHNWSFESNENDGVDTYYVDVVGWTLVEQVQKKPLAMHLPNPSFQGGLHIKRHIPLVWLGDPWEITNEWFWRSSLGSFGIVFVDGPILA